MLWNSHHLSPLSWQFNNLCCLFATQLVQVLDVFTWVNYPSENIQDLYSYITTLTSSASIVLMGDFKSPDQTFASSTVSSDHLCDLAHN